MPRDLPDGWRIDGLWFAPKGTRNARYTKYSPNMTDAQIESADRIVVKFTAADGQTDYRTINGARSRKQIGDLINRVTMTVSPV